MKMGNPLCLYRGFFFFDSSFVFLRAFGGNIISSSTPVDLLCKLRSIFANGDFHEFSLVM